MEIAELKEILTRMHEDGYGDWVLWMCDDDNDDYSVNHIYVDDDGDICLESTDTEGDNYDFTADDILGRIGRYSDDSYVYFLEEYEDESSCAYDIDDEWYIGSDDYGNDVLNLDCYECD